MSTYDSNHLYLSGTDFLGNPLPTTSYYQSTIDSSGQCQGDCDPNGLPLNNRLKSVTVSPASGTTYTTSYAYNLLTNTTTITYPPDGTNTVGTATMVYDTMGDLLSSIDPLGNKATNTYDANQNLLSTTDPLNYLTCYTYDGNGNRKSVGYPVPNINNTCSTIVSTTNYNAYSAVGRKLLKPPVGGPVL